MADKAPATGLRNLIASEDEYAVGALLALYNQGENVFKPVDAVLTDMAKFYLKRGYLTTNQVSFVRRKIDKYMTQLESIGVSPMPIQTAPLKETVPVLAELDGNNISLRFPYNEETVAWVKTIPGRTWNKELRTWFIPLNRASLSRLSDEKFPIGPNLKAFMEDMDKPAPSNFRMPDLKIVPFQYQKDGVEMIDKMNGRALLADEMGLGKTVQAIAYCALHPQKRPVIAVVPASLKLNWAKEFRMWTGMKDSQITVISGNFSSANAASMNWNAEVFIINYDILNSWVASLLILKPQVVIFDEGHMLKESKTIRTKASMKLASYIPHVLVLTGTPILQRPKEIFNPVRMIDKRIFPSFMKFAERYCGMAHNGWGYTYNGATNTAELHQILIDTVMIRRLKADVLKDLPPKIRSVVPLEINNQAEYDKAEADFITWLAGIDPDKAASASRAQAIAKISYLKQLAVKGKMKEAKEWINNFLESGKKLVVFAWHTEVIKYLKSIWKDSCVVVDGSVTGPKRQEAVEMFQNDDSIRLFIGNLKAAGVGLTLTAASDTCFLELGWTPSDMDQCEDRCHRIGATGDSVNAWYLLGQNTIDEKIAALLDSKRAVVTKVLDGQDITEESMLSELLNSFRRG